MRNSITTRIPQPSTITATWLFLMGVTFATYLLAEKGLGGLTISGLVLGSVLLKGHLIVDHFMDLRRTKMAWRILMAGYLALLLGLLFLAYWQAAH